MWTCTDISSKHKHTHDLGHLGKHTAHLYIGMSPIVCVYKHYAHSQLMCMLSELTQTLKGKVFIVLLDFKDSQRNVKSASTLHALEGREMHTEFWQERDHLEDKAVEGKITVT